MHVRVSRCRACPCCRVRFRARRGCRRQAPSSEHQSPFACAGTGVAQCTPCCAGPASVCPSEDAVRPATDMFGGTRASDEQQGMPARKADSDCLEQREPCCTCGRVCSTGHTTCIACVAQGTLDVLRVVQGTPRACGAGPASWCTNKPVAVKSANLRQHQSPRSWRHRCV